MRGCWISERVKSASRIKNLPKSPNLKFTKFSNSLNFQIHQIKKNIAFQMKSPNLMLIKFPLYRIVSQLHYITSTTPQLQSLHHVRVHCLPTVTAGRSAREVFSFFSLVLSGAAACRLLHWRYLFRNNGHEIMQCWWSWPNKCTWSIAIAPTCMASFLFLVLHILGYF